MATNKAMNETFKDYKFEDNLQNAIITNIQLYKRTNTLLINLKSEEFIQLKSIAKFEAFIYDRFKISHTWIDMQYGENAIIPSVEKDWKNIMALLAKKYPIARQLLASAKLELEDNVLNIYIGMRGADFLVARGLDTGLEKLIESIYKKKYKVNYIEKVSEETERIIKQRKVQLEKMAVENLASEIDFENLNKPKTESKSKTNNEKEPNVVGVALLGDPKEENIKNRSPISSTSMRRTKTDVSTIAGFTRKFRRRSITINIGKKHEYKSTAYKNRRYRCRIWHSMY